MKELSLSNLRDDGACQAGIDWITPLLRDGDPPAHRWTEHPDWLAWAVRHNYALDLTAILAAYLNTIGDLRVVAEEILREHPERLDDETITALVSADAQLASLVISCHSHRLDHHMVHDLVRCYPLCGYAAIVHCPERLTDETILTLVRHDPRNARAAIRSCPERLSDDTLQALFARDRYYAWRALESCPERLPDSLRDELEAEEAAEGALLA